MKDIVTYINGAKVNNPLNLQSLNASVSYTRYGQPHITFGGDLAFGRGDLSDPQDPYNLIMSYVSSGQLDAGLDVLIESIEGNDRITLLDAILNIWDATYDPTNRNVICPVLPKKNTDLFEEKAKAVVFQYLRSVKHIKDSDIIVAPYCINNPVDYVSTAVSLFLIFTMVTTIKQEIESIKEIASAESTSTDPWVAALKIASKVAYVSTLIYTIINTIIDIINQLVQPVKYIAGCSVLRHLQIGFEYMGYSFSSSIFDGDEKYLHIFPERYNNPKNSNLQDLKGWIVPDKDKTNGVFWGNFKQFIDIFLDYYNAKLVFDGNNVRMELADYKPYTCTFKVPDIPRKYKYNYDDYTVNYLLSFQTDLNDRNTIQDYLGTYYSYSGRPAGSDKIKTLSKGGKEIQIPFSLFRTKTDLTAAEKVLDAGLKVIGGLIDTLINTINAAIDIINGLFKVITKIIKALKVIGIKINVNISSINKLGTTNIGNIIENRIGMFVLENDIVYSPKLAYVKPSPNDKNNKQYKELKAGDVFKQYHYPNIYQSGNQYILYEETPDIPISFDDFKDLQGSNYIGGGEEVEAVTWSPYHKKGRIISKKVSKIITTFTEEVYESDGR